MIGLPASRTHPELFDTAHIFSIFPIPIVQETLNLINNCSPQSHHDDISRHQTTSHLAPVMAVIFVWCNRNVRASCLKFRVSFLSLRTRRRHLVPKSQTHRMRVNIRIPFRNFQYHYIRKTHDLCLVYHSPGVVRVPLYPSALAMVVEPDQHTICSRVENLEYNPLVCASAAFAHMIHCRWCCVAVDVRRHPLARAVVCMHQCA